jgi:hypothetical protein
VIQPIESHWEVAKKLLLEQYRDSVRFQECLKAVVDLGDEVETLFLSALWSLDFTDRSGQGLPTGTRLDRIGAVAEVTRVFGEPDIDYWSRIVAEVSADCSGTPEAIMDRVRYLTGGQATYDPEFPAGFVVLPINPLRPLTQQQLDQASPSGVQGVVGCYLVDAYEDNIVMALGEPILVVGPCIGAFRLVTESGLSILAENDESIILETIL